MAGNTIVHIMTDNYRINQEFYDFIKKNFKIDDHKFLIYKISEKEHYEHDYLNEQNVFIFEDSYIKSLKLLFGCDKIVFHGWDSRIGLILTAFAVLNRKCYLIPWGGDFFSYNFEKKTLKRRLIYLLKRRALKNANEIDFIDYDDSKRLKSIYNVNNDFSVIHYFDSREYNIVTNMKLPDKLNTDEINVLICNNANATNMHIEALEKLSSYRNENLKIHIFLSAGGDKKYIEKVCQRATELFGNKAILYCDLLSQEEYFSVLSSIDVAVFSNVRLQGIFTAYALLYFGCKFFCRKNNGTYEVIKNELKCELFDYDNVGKISFDDFKQIDISAKKYNKSRLMNTVFNEEYAVDSWKHIFDPEK